MTSGRLISALCASVLLLGTAACGSDGDAGGASMMMNDPDATPADQVGGDVAEGTFTVLDTAPPGSEGVDGAAWLAQNSDGTTVTIRLAGLRPETKYIAHLHRQPCDQENGGAHFRFDPDGKAAPPNEVHLAFTSTDDGTGDVTVTNDRKVGPGAKAVVVHPRRAMDNRLACAEF